MLCGLVKLLARSQAFVLFLALVIAISSSCSLACFIRNCPKGGKRSMDQALLPKRECMRCGAGGAGGEWRCVGPDICCSARAGCHIGTAEARVCQEENRSTAPCLVKGESCGQSGHGKCVADRLCCDAESCAVNERCRLTQGDLPDFGGSGDNILELIQKLLRVKE